VQFVAPNDVRAVVETVERPDVEGARGGGAIEALVHRPFDLQPSARVVPEPGGYD